MTTAYAPMFAAPAADAPAAVRDAHGVVGAPRVVLRLEGAAMLLAATVAYAHVGPGWVRFAALFLLPDLSMLGFLAGARAGAIAYNAGHSYVGPALVAALALLGGHAAALPVALIWAAHIGFDRMLGYGLKYATAFGATHLAQNDAVRTHAQAVAHLHS